MNVRGGCKGSDEERSTWSGGTIAREASDSAVSPRVWGESETQTHRENHHLTFSIPQQFSIIFINNIHTIRTSIKTIKTRVNSTRFEAIYSNFRLIGALFIIKYFIISKILLLIFSNILLNTNIFILSYFTIFTIYF